MSQSTSALASFPPEIRYAPRPVIGLFGGGFSLHNTICKSLAPISDVTATSNTNPLWWRRRVGDPSAGGCMVQLLSIADVTVPPIVRKKPIRANYDGYVCDGVLRADWLHRHAFEVPSLVVMLVAWPPASESDLVRVVDATRQALRSRSIKLTICFVLVSMPYLMQLQLKLVLRGCFDQICNRRRMTYRTKDWQRSESRAKLRKIRPYWLDLARPWQRWSHCSPDWRSGSPSTRSVIIAITHEH
jgi:hypothetical protein